MESNSVMFESLPHPGVLPDQNSPFQSECIASALELLGVLREEAGILKRFAGAELLRLVPKKEYLVSELEWKIRSARNEGGSFMPASDSFKAVLREIDELNTTNGVFIEKSLAYWQDLLSVLLPQGYGPAGKKTKRPACSQRGLTYEREI